MPGGKAASLPSVFFSYRSVVTLRMPKRSPEEPRWQHNPSPLAPLLFTACKGSVNPFKGVTKLNLPSEGATFCCLPACPPARGAGSAAPREGPQCGAGLGTARRARPAARGAGARRRARPAEAATHTFVDVQLQLLLRDALLDPLAEGRVAGGAHAAVPVVDEAAALAIKGGCGRPIPAVLLGAETIHRPPARRSPCAGSREPPKVPLWPPPPRRALGGTPPPLRGPPQSHRGPLTAGIPLSAGVKGRAAGRVARCHPSAVATAAGPDPPSAAGRGGAGTPHAALPLTHTYTHTQNRLPGSGNPAPPPRRRGAGWAARPEGRGAMPPLRACIGERRCLSPAAARPRPAPAFAR